VALVALTFELFPYQVEAFDAFMARSSLLLALDTGLGKTATATAISEKLLERRQVFKSLYIVPASLKLQWAMALAKSTDLPATEILVKGEKVVIPDPSACVIVDGTPERRARLYELAKARSVEYVIVGYDQAVTEWRQIKALGCEFVVLDEASAIKTPGTKRSRAIKRHFRDVPFRLALTATPIENRPEEVFSIMSWVDETVLGRYDYFDKTFIERDVFGNVTRYKHLDLFHEKLSRAMVRKTREDPEVAPFLPEVRHEVWNVELDDETWDAYKAMLADLLAAYDDVSNIGSFNVDAHYGLAARDDKRGDKSSLGRLMSIHECMQLLLNHPTLVAQSASLFQTTTDRGSKYAASLMLDGFRLPSAQPKLDLLFRKVTAILDRDPAAKVIIFTRYKLMLRIIQDILAGFGHGYASEIYDGDLTAREKQAAVTRFKQRPEIRLLLSSHAGAYGVDLPEASWLVNYDDPQGAGIARQINGRHVRASSTHEVVWIVNMLCEGTIEERKHAQLEFKGDISSHIIDGNVRDSGELMSEVMSLKSHAQSVLDPDGTSEIS
jgi:SNF2 family DNA or RNA helicase